jgi:hypothetical protein
MLPLVHRAVLFGVAFDMACMRRHFPVHCQHALCQGAVGCRYINLEYGVSTFESSSLSLARSLHA